LAQCGRQTDETISGPSGPNGPLGTIGQILLPDASTVEQERFRIAVGQAIDDARRKQGVWNSPEFNQPGSRWATGYDGYDVGVYVYRRSRWFRDDEFENLNPSISAAEGYGLDSGLSVFHPTGVAATVIVPTPHRYPGHRPTNDDYARRVETSLHIYRATGRRTHAPVIVVTPTSVHIIGGAQ
jgi:hypothetical protein